MNPPARQSYYEIALTNRQVLSVFVVLLVAVLAAFLSGMWVGRESSKGEGKGRVETAEAQQIEAANDPDEEPAERFDFFSRGEDAANIPAGTEATESTDPATEPPEPREPEPSTPVVEATMAEVADEPEPESSTPDMESTVAETADEPEVTVPEPEPVAPAPVTAGTLVVQVFSSSNQVQAQGVVDRLRAGGLPALLSPVEVSGRTMYRVRIGPYVDRQVAEGIAAQVRSDYRLETWITE